MSKSTNYIYYGPFKECASSLGVKDPVLDVGLGYSMYSQLFKAFPKVGEE